MYLFVLHSLAGKCTKIYNACRTFVRLIKPLVLRHFRCRCGCAVGVVPLWSIKGHDVDLAVFCLLLYLWFKPGSQWKIPSKQLSSSTLEKDCTICPWKFLENRPGIFGRMVSALCLPGCTARVHRGFVWYETSILSVEISSGRKSFTIRAIYKISSPLAFLIVAVLSIFTRKKLFSC